MHVNTILSLEFGQDLIAAYRQCIKFCVDSSANTSKLKKIQRHLLKAEEEMAEEFAARNCLLFVIDYGSKEEYFFWSFLRLLCTTVCELVKFDLCNNRSSVILQVSELIEMAFSLEFRLLERKFEVEQNSSLIKESVYYIMG